MPLTTTDSLPPPPLPFLKGANKIHHTKFDFPYSHARGKHPFFPFACLIHETVPVPGSPSLIDHTSTSASMNNYPNPKYIRGRSTCIPSKYYWQQACLSLNFWFKYFCAPARSVQIMGVCSCMMKSPFPPLPLSFFRTQSLPIYLSPNGRMGGRTQLLWGRFESLYFWEFGKLYWNSGGGFGYVVCVQHELWKIYPRGRVLFPTIQKHCKWDQLGADEHSPWISYLIIFTLFFVTKQFQSSFCVLFYSTEFLLLFIIYFLNVMVLNCELNCQLCFCIYIFRLTF